MIYGSTTMTTVLAHHVETNAIIVDYFNTVRSCLTQCWDLSNDTELPYEEQSRPPDDHRI
jgi:hypothetical protein